MKSMLFSALVIFALATTGCALQSGAGGCSDGLCGNHSGGSGDCSALSGDCGCGSPRGLEPSCNLMRKLSDNRGMGLRVNQKGSACDQGRNNGLFARIGGGSSVAPAASMGSGCGGAVSGGCGCDGGSSAINSDGGCGCGDVGSIVTSDAGCGAETGGLLSKLGSKCKLGNCKLGNCKLGNCKLGKCLLGRGDGAGPGSAVVGQGVLGGGGIGHGAIGGGCGINGCGIGGGLCGSCLSSKLAQAHHNPYGGAIPHTAQVPGNGTGTAPAYAYPYYTTRGPRDFLMKNPPSIGY